MLLSDIRRSSKSPIGTVPYDVLLEIFVHCLPQERFGLDGCRTNTRIAPILLCHICSPWRTIALATPILWSHLSFLFTVQEIHEDQGGWAFLQNEIEFIRWWKKNQGSIPPFLSLEFEFTGSTSGHIAGGGMTFVMEYVTTAQYLETNPIFWTDLVGPMFEAGDQVTFPNLHTLVTSPSQYSTPPAFIAIQAAIEHASNYTPSVLRRLAMVEACTPDADEYITIPIPSSSLTHLSISTIDLSLSWWIPLTSAIPCLQWAYISFEFLSDTDIDENMDPVKRTLPQLSTLVIESCDGDDCLMGPLFNGLHLPTLQNLLLSSLAAEWWDHHGIPDIGTILQSAPALSALTLRKYSGLSPIEIDYSKVTLPVARDVTPWPIWHCVPHLAHLQLELHIKHAHDEIDLGKDWDIFAHSAFFSNNPWLDLDNSACPIKTITVIDGWPMYNNRQRETAATPSLRTCAGNATNITFRLPSESYTYFADLWMTWRSGI